MPQQKLIGICLSTVHEEDRFNFVNALNKRALQHDYHLIVFNSCADLYDQTPQNNEGSSAVFRLIPYHKLSALILFPQIMYDPEMVDEIISNCKAHDIPIISMDKKMDGCMMFTFSNADIFEKMCRHVIEFHGKKDVMMMAGFPDNVYSKERVNAFRRVLEDNGLPFKKENIGYGCFWEKPTIDEMHRWFDDGKRAIPEAIICANDFMAISVSGFLQEMGVRVPEDCIVTGFDGIHQIEYLPPVISTCRQDFDTMARLIIEAIVRMNSGEGQLTDSVSVDFSLDLSESCGCRPVTYDKVRHSIQELLTSLRLSEERQKMINSAQASIPKIADFNYLPRNILNKFHFDTCVLAVNQGVFDPPDFGSHFRDEHCFSECIDIVYQKYTGQEFAQCKIPLKNLLPRFDIVCMNDNPIIICCANFTDMVMGYAAFQPDINIDEYRKIHSIMGTIGSALGSFHSRTQIRSFNQELRKLSQHDFLTELYNRRGFFGKLKTLIKENENSGRELVLISVDLDGLKYINDNFGHAEGDNAITTVSKALLECSSPREICARFGGDEFSVAAVVEAGDAAAFYNGFKEKFLLYLSNYNRSSGKTYAVHASIGCSCAAINDKLDTDDMIKTADGEMYAYKLANKVKR